MERIFGIGHNPPAMAAPPKPTSNEAIGQRLKALRFALGYGERQAAFAKLVNIPPNTWNNYETGIRQPNGEMVARIRQATGVTRDWVYEGSVSGMSVDLMQKLGDAAPAQKGKRAGGA